MKPDYKLYFSIMLFPTLAIIVSCFLNIEERVFSILSGVCTGILTSTVVAFLIDKANCRAERKRLAQIQGMYYLNLLLRYSFLLEMFMQMSDESNKEQKNWREWAEEFINRRTKRKTEFIIRQMEPVLNELRRIQEQKAILVYEHILSAKEAYALEQVESFLDFLKNDLAYDDEKVCAVEKSLSETMGTKTSIERNIDSWHMWASTSSLLKEFNNVKYNSMGSLQRMALNIATKIEV